MILSPSPPPTEPVHTPSTQGTDLDPRIASLKAIFPDFDDAVILSVLESTDNDHDRALDVLLGMNDPSFVPPAVPVPQSVPYTDRFSSPQSADPQHLSQEALDEQLARRLALEEQQAAVQEAGAQAWPSPPPQGVEGQAIYQPYQARRGGRNGWGGPPHPQGQGGRDTMTEFQEGFNRIAESGKKTFSSIVSKVRAKMQEFEHGQGWSGSQNAPPNQPARPVSTSYYSSYTPGPPQLPGQGAYAQPYSSPQPPNPPGQASQTWPSRTSTLPSAPPRSGVLRPVETDPIPPTTLQHPSYYDPNARGYDLYGDDDHEDIQLVNNTTLPATASAPESASTPAATSTLTTAQIIATPPRTDSPAPPLPLSETSSPPSYASPTASSPSPSHARLGSPPARSFSPTTAARTTGPSGNVDFSKLGLLPKRPISLVRPQSPPAPRVTASHSESTTGSSLVDRNESEFVENPFEDHP